MPIRKCLPPMLALSAALMAAGCALRSGTDAAASAKSPGQTPTEVVRPAPTWREAPDPGPLKAVAASQTAFDKDRQAILGMQGEFEVHFHFRETVILAPDYTRRDNKTSGAFETVLLVQDQGEHIVLQHLLVSQDGRHVIKHWRQDWHYQARERLEFSEDQVWRVRPIAARGPAAHWTQCVYEVSDAPRYCGTGRWNHRYGVSTWTSDRTWRPLPRREYTTRNDYNALNVENRHTLTPDGWTHEQDNTKTVREGEHTARTLVREFGFNHYRRITGFDFSPARDYWNATAAYWARVRGQWAQRIARDRGLRLVYPVDGMDMIAEAFSQAGRAADGETISEAELATLFDRWVTTPDPRLAGARIPSDEPTPP